MKTTLRFLSLVLFFSFGQFIFAELPSHIKTSDDENEYWYFIQNGINHAETGTAAVRNGVYLTSFGGDAESSQVRGHNMILSGNKDYQLWKLIESSDSIGCYYLVNKATGNPMSIGTGEKLEGTNGENKTLGPNFGNRYYTVASNATLFDIDVCRTSFRGQAVSERFVSIRRTVPGEFQKNLLGMFGNNSLLAAFDHNATYFSPQMTMTESLRSPRSWAFIPEEEGIERYPLLSNEEEENWYNIMSASSNTSYKGQIITVVDDFVPTVLEHKDNDNLENEFQMWKFEKVEGSEWCDSIYLISQTGVFMEASGMSVSTEPSPFVLQHLFDDDNQFRILPYSAGTYGEAQSQALFVNSSFEIESGNANNYVFNSVAAFKFVPIEEEIIEEPEVEVKSELPEHIKVSDDSNEYWYYIQNGINHKETGTAIHRSGTYITSYGGEFDSDQVRGSHLLMSGNREYQLWKLVASPDSEGNYHLINKATGNALSIGTGDVLGTGVGEDTTLGANFGNRYYTVPGAASNFDIDKGRDSYHGDIVSQKYVSIRRVSMDGEDENVKLLATFGQASALSVFDHNDTYFGFKGSFLSSLESPRSWAFVPQDECDARYPTLSTENDEKWYNIVSASTNSEFNGKLLTSQFEFNPAFLDDEVAGDDGQIWKFVKVDGTAHSDSVYVVSKLGYYLAENGEAVSSPSPIVLQHFFADDNQFRFTPYNAGALGEWDSQAVFINENMELEFAEKANNYVYGSAAAFYIKEITATSVKGVNDNGFNYKLSVINGYLTVENCLEKVELYTISGMQVDPTNQLKTGVYLVKIGDKAQKLIVQ